ncbi:MAG: hypothetical protein AUJ54_05810 [Ignavibacteria bacterium CG1_02_37_35]|nr:hypothetical protein [Ignavibacteria bacterium]OIO20240.1 MAG: hypothetical protein AUJ54_05810 [Ignavibacteria bacterium CG1_02_37_35]PJC59040.1 MAG: hypothetical protein CO025_07430 [Ignavibacteria bacterium CG_4_9_14_0_2_um_filter_37_13]
MRTYYFFVTVLILVVGSVVTGCDYSREKKVENAKENVQQANSDLKAAQAEYDKEWQQFQKDAEFRIRTNENRIGEFKAEIQTARGRFKVKYEKEVVKLELRNIELKKKIRDYKYEGKDDWEEFKRGFNHDLDVVGTALNDFFTKKD